MGLKDCKIVLDNPWSVFHPGETISGYVECTFDSTKKVWGIYINFKGYAETSWVEYRASKSRVDVACSGNEEYFNNSYYLLGDLVSFKPNKLEIPAGTHRYPFICILPPRLPTSFEGDFGFIRYTIKTVLDRPWKFNHVTKMAFTVVNHLDLNLNSEYKLPTSIHMEETFLCHFWCSSVSLLVTLCTPFSAYCSGQLMPLDIVCENHSDVDVAHIIVALRQVVKYTCQIPMHEVKIARQEIGHVTLGTVKSKSKKTWKRLLKVPPLPPTSFDTCKLIDVHYDIKVKCLHSGMHPDIKDKTIMVIGTVPVVHNTHGANTEIVDSTHNSMILRYPSIGYPKYEEGIHEASTILENGESPMTHIQHSTKFKPKYPIYKYSALPGNTHDSIL